ncbi:hypothetical protein [Kitasatospora sp. NPDC059803]|uniref:hypothetical protein n=1 Tax=Kitasatospora sp. NPDC059803 TaxID=3346953 RepID=UPI0036673CE2
MKTEYIDGEYVLKLNRSELVVVISAMLTADNLTASDEALWDYIGRTREDFQEMTTRIADFCRSVPYTPDGDSLP